MSIGVPAERGLEAPEQSLERGNWPRHRHTQPYAAFILEGSYYEFGDQGRFQVEAGDVVAHGAYEAHGNAVARSYVVNFALPEGHGLPALFRARAPDSLLSALRQGESLPEIEFDEVAGRRADDWPDKLATKLNEGPVVLERWAEEHGMRPESLSRGFSRAYGVTPARFRHEQQARRALTEIRSSRQSLVEIALAAGFADQAHMTRAIRALTDCTPAAWRKVNSV